jgi:[ribosomal protein S5]-alanine N-acetyltransferase
MTAAAPRKPLYRWGQKLPTLPAGRIELRALTGRGAGAIYSIFGDPEVMRFWSSPPLESAAAARLLIDDIQRRFRERTLFQWGIARRDDGGVIGTCTIFHLHRDHRRAEIGYALGRRSWGQGFATEALGALIEFAFGVLDLERLEADTDPHNARSIRVLERQGFRREGYLRQRWRVGGGTQDALFFGLLKQEWTRGREPA